jgi:hypothetical protein
VLIYNLPEAVRESDLAKLSFAAELATAFYGAGDNGDGNGDGVDGAAGAADAAPALEPGAMLWLIQRDFLEGGSPKAALRAALAQVPNPAGDADIGRLNRIRAGLGALAADSSALGLPQPHLERTRLCELADAELDPAYLAARDALRAAVHAAAAPKRARGAALDGKALADLARKAVAALNARDIPTAGALVELFNADLLAACARGYAATLEALPLPADDAALAAAAGAAAADARARFARERFGAAVPVAAAALAAALDKERAARATANELASAGVCGRAEEMCEAVLEEEARRALPSTGRFDARYAECSRRFALACVGPARAHSEERLARAHARERARFERDYNERLLTGLVFAALAAVLLFRFALRWPLAEAAAWLAFAFLQLWPRAFVGGASMFEAGWWRRVVAAWEAVVWNPLARLAPGWGGAGLLALLALCLVRRRRAKDSRGCCGARRARRRPKYVHTSGRDLDV